MYQNILVAIDGSPTSDLALHEAFRVAKDGARVIAITVVENPLIGYEEPFVTYNYEKIHEVLLEQGQKILNNAKNDAQHLGHIKIETHLIDVGPSADHDVSSAILKASKDYQADLIVIGRHGRSGVVRFFLGSIAEQVIRKSLIPVLIVRGVSHDKK